MDVIRMRIKLKTTAVIALFILMICCFMSCASYQDSAQEDIHLQETKTFKDHTFGEVWEAAIRAVDEIDFVIQKRLVKSGFIYAQGREAQDSIYLPPHMNIYIRREYGEISVHCHVVIPDDPANYDVSSGYVDMFFAALNRNLQ